MENFHYNSRCVCKRVSESNCVCAKNHFHSDYTIIWFLFHFLYPTYHRNMEIQCNTQMTTSSQVCMTVVWRWWFLYGIWFWWWWCAVSCGKWEEEIAMKENVLKMWKWKLTCYYPDVWKRLPCIHTYLKYRVIIMLTYNKEHKDIQAIIIAMPRVIWDAWKRKSFDNREDDADRCGRGIQMYMQFPFFFRSVRRGVIFKNYPKMGFWVHSSSFDHVNSIERDGGLYCVWTGQALLSI